MSQSDHNKQLPLYNEYVTLFFFLSKV